MSVLSVVMLTNLCLCQLVCLVKDISLLPRRSVLAPGRGPQSIFIELIKGILFLLVVSSFLLESALVKLPLHPLAILFIT
jgi:hypothetical protein